MRVKDIQKEELILKSSLKLINKECGINGLTMARIAKESGLAIGTLYIYFKNKEELLNELYLRLRKKALKRFYMDVSVKNSVLQNFKIIWHNYLMHRIDFFQESIFLEQFYRSDLISENQLNLAELMKKPVYKLIERGKLEGVLRTDIDNEMLFLVQLGCIRELADEHVRNIYILNTEKTTQAFELCWEIIKTK